MPLACFVAERKHDRPKPTHEGDAVWMLHHEHTVALLTLWHWGQQIWLPDLVVLVLFSPSVVVVPLAGRLNLLRGGVLEILIEDLLGPPG